MFHISFALNNIRELDSILSTTSVKDAAAKSNRVFAQVFLSKADETFAIQLNESVRKVLPNAIVVGTTTSGEITEGKSITNSNVLSLSFFQETELEVITADCPDGFEKEVGKAVYEKIMQASADIKGVFLVATTQSLDSVNLLNGMQGLTENFPLFGAGAGSYYNNHSSFIFYGNDIYKKGIICVVFSGKDLHIDVHSYLGWQALSREMSVTEVDGNFWVKKIDSSPAVSVYEKYLKIDRNDDFFSNVIEFPLVVMRNGCELARVPAFYAEDGSLHLGADVRKGEKVRLAYGSPELIITNSSNTQRLMAQFKPQGIFLYSCVCRQIFLQESVQLETLPFQDIAPTSGFYTYGEFFGKDRNLNLLNATMLVVGFREGSKKETNEIIDENLDPEKKTSKISLSARLVHFIETVVSELEDANKELQILSNTDKLTHLYNRGKISSIFRSEIEKVKKLNTNLSIILLDVDHFKHINDKYGHHAGDNVLKKLANTLKCNIRSTDVVGRWGGEEFMIILRDTDLQTAGLLAEKIRESISKTDFGPFCNITASFGVVSVKSHETEIQVYNRVDSALYEAKNRGRNKVVLG